jgi:uncharacterized membrane protein
VTSASVPDSSPGQPRFAARTQISVAAAVGVLIGVSTSFFVAPKFAALFGWDAAAAVYVGWVWLEVWPADQHRTVKHAVSTDPTRAASDLLLLGAATASLVAVGFVLGSAAQSKGTVELLRVALALVSVGLSWTVLHTVYTLQYARLYYSGPDGGVSFNQRDLPTYSDFAYLAFTIGMTFQVSDTDLQDSAIRRTALRQALLSYVFGTGILATTVNLVASLTTSH